VIGDDPPINQEAAIRASPDTVERLGIAIKPDLLRVTGAKTSCADCLESDFARSYPVVSCAQVCRVDQWLGFLFL
jgi:hypothetical protein